MISRVAWVFASLALVACGGGSSTGGGDGLDGGGSSSGSGSSNGGGNGSGSGGSSGSVSSSSGGSGGTTSSGGSGTGSSSGGTGSGSGSTSSSGSGSGGGSGSSSGGSGECMTASDCPGQVCCATIPITGGSIPNCTNGTLTSACKAASACPTHLAIACSGTEEVQICSTAADCTNAGAGNTMCCTFTSDGGSLSFCASSFIGGVGGGTCK